MKCPFCGKVIPAKKPIDLKKAVDAYERHLVKEALEIANGNQTQAAKLLNLEFHSMRWYVKKFGLVKKKSHTK